VDVLYRAARNALGGRGWGGFHQDRVYRALVLDLLDAMAFTTFVETGTFRGHSTELVASRKPDLPIYTVEAVRETYDRARRALKRYPNITMILGSSDEAVRKLIADGKPGALPLYYLDAHWQTYWPLRDELKAIGTAGGRAVMVIDDFEVPSQPQFGYDIDGGADITVGAKCNLDYIRPALDTARHTYHAVFPKYAMFDAFGPGKTGPLRGHIVLFQNMEEEYEAFLKRPLAQQHYFGHGQVT
jgi:predicted O-methyltransferase YrrM